MIKSLAILALAFTNNLAGPPPSTYKPPSRPIEIGIILPAPAPEIKPLELFKLEEIQPLEYVGLTVQGEGNRANTYAWGNCTWYVANNRNVPDTWGNAATWYPRATEDGYSTGSEPKPGAIAWFPPGRSLGHVALVKAINGDGTIIISEMNSRGLGVVSERLINASEVRYIY